MFKPDLEKAEEPEIKWPTSTGSLKKQESSRKNSTSVLLTMPKPLNVWITTNCGKFFKRWEYQTTFPASCKTCSQVKKQQLEPDVEQWTGSKWGKESVEVVYCHPACLTSMQSTPSKWWCCKLDKGALGTWRWPESCSFFSGSSSLHPSLSLELAEEGWGPGFPSEGFLFLSCGQFHFPFLPLTEWVRIIPLNQAVGLLWCPPLLPWETGGCPVRLS